MKIIVDWASSRARMVISFIVLSLVAGGFSYIGLPKEGEPDIQIPVVFVSVPFQGISAEDSENLLVKPLETELSEIRDLKKYSSTASEGYAGIALSFNFGWDRVGTLAEIRDKLKKAEASFPVGASQSSINEINFSEFPIVIVTISGNVPERSLTKVAMELQKTIETIPSVLETGLTGTRDEMVEVLIDPSKLEAYNITAQELITIVRQNNQLIAAGEIEIGRGSYAIKIPSSFNSTADVYKLPVKTNGNRIVTLGDIADIRLTFQDRYGTARFNGEQTMAIQVIKRKGSNLIETVARVREIVGTHQKSWPPEIQDAVQVNFSLDNSREVKGMVKQLESSVLTAIALVMIVVLASLGVRSALLVGFAIPTSFMLTFALLAIFGISISNIVMFGLILAVGILVDGAIVVVEYADKKIRQGTGPMQAYRTSARRMFWPIISSTATTLCAFLPMLFWPGVAGQFMRNLPVTLIFVLSASLIVALIYLPIVGGVAGRVSRKMSNLSLTLKSGLSLKSRVFCLFGVLGLCFFILIVTLKAVFINQDFFQAVFSSLAFLLLCSFISIINASFRNQVQPIEDRLIGHRTIFGKIIHFLIGNPVMPIISLTLSVILIFSIFKAYEKFGKGVEFFVETEPQQAIAYIQARGNMSLYEKDRLVKKVENKILEVSGIESIFAFTGPGGFVNGQNIGSDKPNDTIGQVQIEFAPWDQREPAINILSKLNSSLSDLPGIKAQLIEQDGGPGSSSPIFIRLIGNNWQDLQSATKTIRKKMSTNEAIVEIQDSRPLPGIDWEFDIDVRTAGRYGTDVFTIGGMIQLITKGIILGKMRTSSSDEEVDIRVRFPKKDRLISTIDTLKLRTELGMIPLSNFVSKKPVPEINSIQRVNGSRVFYIRANVIEGANATNEITKLETWLNNEAELPSSIKWDFTGDFEEQGESLNFLAKAFAGALGLMFIILLAQFNSFYNSILVLIAVIMSTAGVMVGMLVMDQTFSAIMTGTGIVALAGIVVNNNIVLIDTYQDYLKSMPVIEAIIKTAEDRIRPVLLTTTTTMAGLTPMMFGVSLDFANGGFTIDSPTALWWKQLATAIVFGLGFATILTLVITPSLLALRYWISQGLRRVSQSILIALAKTSLKL